MAFGDSATLLDDFDRTNEGPPLSSLYTSITNGMKVASNLAAGNTSLSANIDFRNDATYGADVEVYVTVTTKGGTNQYSSVFARMTTLASGTMDGYEVRANPAAGTDTFTIYRIDNGTATSIGSASAEFASGDKIGISCIGSTIKAYQFTGGSWSEIVSASDATYGAAGYIGLGQVHTTGRLNDLYVGTIGAAVNYGFLKRNPSNQAVERANF